MEGIGAEIGKVETAVADEVATLGTRVKDVMRRTTRTLTDAEQSALDEIKTMGNHLYALFEDIEMAPSREISLAKTKLEEAIMWASKHITK